MREQSCDSEVPVCRDWPDIVEYVEEFPVLGEILAEDGNCWIFRGQPRGQPDNEFVLKPTIERKAEGKGKSWAALEKQVGFEYESHARLHLSVAQIPEDKLTWLALMQHYAIPTRLLDFTYSPFVALFFAARRSHGDKGEAQQQSERSSSDMRLWAIDATAVIEEFRRAAVRAREKEREFNGKERRTEPVFRDLASTFASDAEHLDSEYRELRKLINEALSPTAIRSFEFGRLGCVAVAVPPTFNPRLASQQGLFLVNCAEELSLQKSLDTMMKERGGAWLRRLDIPTTILSEVEKRLFQMNIHEQSLFPDMEGLARFIDQKIRLHWK